MIFIKENVLKHVDKMVEDLNFPEQIGSLQELKKLLLKLLIIAQVKIDQSNCILV